MRSKRLEAPERCMERRSTGRYALNPPPLERLTSQSPTHPEMPAVSVPLPLPLGGESEPQTDADRITEVSGMPRADQRVHRFVLLRLDGVDAGSVASVGTGLLAIGRHTSNQIQIKEGGVSRVHAHIHWLSGVHVLEDASSSNGTFVNGHRITRAVLSDGDLLQLGSHACFRYTKTDEMHERLLHQLFESSTRDALTGAYNRRHFDERLRAELAYASRHGTELSLILMDIDLFKQVNDTHGHQAGDAVLKQVAHISARQLRSEDVFARHGGEEFAVLLRGIGRSDTLRVAERIRASVEALPVTNDGKLIGVTLSAGLAALSECELPTAARFVALADERLYAAKRAGRNRVVGGF